MKDVMIDIETLGAGGDNLICQIGACYFDRKTGEIGKTFKVNVDAIDAVQEGFQLDADTVYWWLAQSEEARKSILEQPRVSIRVAIYNLDEFLKDAKFIWSHATFDFVTIMQTYKKLNMKPSFRYSAGLDIRTLIELTKVSISDVPREGTHHDGLADSIHQVKYCMLAFDKLAQLQEAKALISHIKAKI